MLSKISFIPSSDNFQNKIIVYFNKSTYNNSVTSKFNYYGGIVQSEWNNLFSSFSGFAGIIPTELNKSLFQKFKRKVRSEIEQPMLQKMLPEYSEVKDVYTEKHDGNTTFGRQLGSYPLLIGIPGKHKLNEFIDVKIVIMDLGLLPVFLFHLILT